MTTPKLSLTKSPPRDQLFSQPRTDSTTRYSEIRYAPARGIWLHPVRPPLLTNVCFVQSFVEVISQKFGYDSSSTSTSSSNNDSLSEGEIAAVVIVVAVVVLCASVGLYYCCCKKKKAPHKEGSAPQKADQELGERNKEEIKEEVRKEEMKEAGPI